VKDISADLGHTQHMAGSATKASFNASISSASSDSMTVLTIGIVIKISSFTIMSEIF
jgi:hypothetical protein